MTKGTKPAADPPGLPEVPRKTRLYPYQWIGLSLLTLIPALALAGVFGPAVRTERVSTGDLDVVVTYPSRMRYKQVERIQVRIENRSASTADPMELALDSTFASGFSDIRGTPPFESPFVMRLPAVASGGTRLAVIEVEADRYGRHEGDLTISTRATFADDSTHLHGRASATRVPLSVFIFP